MSAEIVMLATVVEGRSGSLHKDGTQRARIRVEGAEQFGRDLTIPNTNQLRLDQKLKMTITTVDEIDPENFSVRNDLVLP